MVLRTFYKGQRDVSSDVPSGLQRQGERHASKLVFFRPSHQTYRTDRRVAERVTEKRAQRFVTNLVSQTPPLSWHGRRYRRPAGHPSADPVGTAWSSFRVKLDSRNHRRFLLASPFERRFRSIQTFFPSLSPKPPDRWTSRRTSRRQKGEALRNQPRKQNAASKLERPTLPTSGGTGRILGRSKRRPRPRTLFSPALEP